jgi:hypothetical protein
MSLRIVVWSAEDGLRDLQTVKHASSPDVWLARASSRSPTTRNRLFSPVRSSHPCNLPYQPSNGCTLFWRRCKVINTAHVSVHRLTRVQVFEQLKKPVDPKVIEQRERELNERAQHQYERAQQRQTEIVSLDGTSVTLDIL